MRHAQMTGMPGHARWRMLQCIGPRSTIDSLVLKRAVRIATVSVFRCDEGLATQHQHPPTYSLAECNANRGSATPSAPPKPHICQLDAAVRARDYEQVRKLLDAGAKVSGYRFTPLHAAIRKYDGRMVQLLLSAGAQVNFTDKQREPLTPLGLAARLGHAQSVQVLLQAGADLNAFAGFDMASGKGGTPLMLAAKFRNFECMKVLIAAGANVNATASTRFCGGRVVTGQTALHMLFDTYGTASVAAVKLLIGAAATVDCVCKDTSGGMVCCEHIPLEMAVCGIVTWQFTCTTQRWRSSA